MWEEMFFYGMFAVPREGMGTGKKRGERGLETHAPFSLISTRRRIVCTSGKSGSGEEVHGRGKRTQTPKKKGAHKPRPLCDLPRGVKQALAMSALGHSERETAL